MEHSDHDGRYLAKVSRIGIIAAILFSLVYGTLSITSVYGFKFRLYLLTSGSFNVIPELAVVAVGAVALLVCGVLSLVLRGKPAVVHTGWIIAGKAILLAAPVGYIRSQLLQTSAGTSQMNFLFSFATLATVFVGYAWGMMPRDGMGDGSKKVTLRRVLRGLAIVGGVMLGAILWLLLLTRKSYGSMLQVLSVEEQRDYLLWRPLNATAPVALAVILGYLVLSLAFLWDRAPKKRLIGKGGALVMWGAFAVAVLDLVLLLLWYSRMMDSALALYYTATRIQLWQQATSTLAPILGLWALCRLLPDLRMSKPALLGARCLLGIIVFRELLSLFLGIMQSMARSGSNGMNIDAYAKWVQAETWGNLILTILTVAALCILTVGLTRHLRVGKGFGAVPALTAASVVLMLLLSALWELILRGADGNTAYWLQAVLTVAVPAVITLIRSLVGSLALARTPAETVTPPPAPAEGAEAPKPRMEDYLYQL